MLDVFSSSHFPPANYHNIITCAAAAIFVATHVCLRIQLEKHSSSIRANRANGVALLKLTLFGKTEHILHDNSKELAF